MSTERYEIWDRGYFGKVLVNMDTFRDVGRIVNHGPYGTEVRDTFNQRVGEIRRETMCGGSFLTFRPGPGPFDPPPLIGGSNSIFGR